jgi:hypothetical protein
MHRLLRGVMQDGGSPTEAEAYRNWKQLEAASLEFLEPEDERIFSYLQRFEVQMAYCVPGPDGRDRMHCAMPDWTLVREYFEKADDIEAGSRLDLIRKCPAYIRQNYKAIIADYRAQQRNRQLVRICRDVATITDHGVKVKGSKDVLRGSAAALQYLNEQIREYSASATDNPFAVTDVSQPVDPVRYLLKHYRLAEGRPNGLIGYAGTSKTFLAIELALAVAAGLRTAWGGCELSQSGPVIHLDYEMGHKMSSRRYQRVASGLGVNLSELVQSKRLSVCNFPTTNLTTPGCEAALCRLCDGAALLLIDSFRAATPDGEDENSSAFRKYLDMLSRVSAETGAIVLIIHHERKAAPGGSSDDPSKDAPGSKLQMARGSSDLADAFGATVHVASAKDGFNIIQGKVSAGRTGASKRCKLDDVGARNEAHDDSEGLAIRGVDLDSDERSKPFRETDAVLGVIEGKTTNGAIADALKESGCGMRNERLGEILAHLQFEGRIERRGKVWHIVDSGDLIQ